MTYSELNNLYKQNKFREIDLDPRATKFYLLRTISKKETFSEFCEKNNLESNIETVFDNEQITKNTISDFIKQTFKKINPNELDQICSELNKMDTFDWGASRKNNLENNIVTHIKKTKCFDDIERAVAGPILESTRNYTLTSWYNHWSSTVIENIFKSNQRVIPTIGLVEKIDFFIDETPFDLKVTHFPDALLQSEISEKIKNKFGRKKILACYKKIAKMANISIPKGLSDKNLTSNLYKLLSESSNTKAKNFITEIKKIMQEIYSQYKKCPEKLIKWLYENQGERRFDAANRFYLVLIDKSNPYDSWKLKRDVELLNKNVNNKIKTFNKNDIIKTTFKDKNGIEYHCLSTMLFVTK